MNQWNIELYQDKHSYVWEYGAKLLAMLSPKPGERILDLGCGTGQLTSEIAAVGAEVVGLDVAEEAIAQCRQHYPHIEFRVANGTDFTCEKSFDAVFSNAALHWIQPPVAAVQCIYQALKPGGRFVAEFGGKGNVQQIIEAINQALDEPEYNPWYFPSIGEYSTLLEQAGFEVNYAALLTRPTKLEGEQGLINWIEMFAVSRFATLSTSTKTTMMQQIESKLRPTLYRNGSWWADYQRLQIVAMKPDN
jgi:trans-aconitate methyltransferase